MTVTNGLEVHKILHNEITYRYQNKGQTTRITLSQMNVAENRYDRRRMYARTLATANYPIKYR